MIDLDSRRESIRSKWDQKIKSNDPLDVQFSQILRTIQRTIITLLSFHRDRKVRTSVPRFYVSKY